MLSLIRLGAQKVLCILGQNACRFCHSILSQFTLRRCNHRFLTKAENVEIKLMVITATGKVCFVRQLWSPHGVIEKVLGRDNRCSQASLQSNSPLFIRHTIRLKESKAAKFTFGDKPSVYQHYIHLAES